MPLQNLLKLFVLPTLQFFTFIESKFISNLNIRKNWFLNSNAEGFESTGFDIPLYAPLLITHL